MTKADVKKEIQAIWEAKLRLEGLYDELYDLLRDATEEQKDGELWKENQQYLNMGYSIGSLDDAIISLGDVLTQEES